MGGVLLRLLRSGGAGALASGADLATLTGLVELASVRPETASVPALTVGNVAMYFGQKYLAFQSGGKPTLRELAPFALVQAGGFALTALGYDLALRVAPALNAHYVGLRLIVTNLVWVGYSFPLWHYVFRPPTVDKHDVRP